MYKIFYNLTFHDSDRDNFALSAMILIACEVQINVTYLSQEGNHLILWMHKRDYVIELSK